MKSSLIHVVMVVVLIALAVLIPLRVFGQQPAPSPQPDLPVDAAAKIVVIDNMIKELNDGYVFAEVAKKIENDIRARQKNKEYDAIAGSRDFAKKLTEDVQSVSHDKHMRVRFSLDPIPVRAGDNEPTEQEKAQFAWTMKRINYAFTKVERMDGNIGYIELNNFFDPEGGADTVAAAFNFVANTDALIIDLRRNGGGDPAMVQLICSYLFGDKSVHLNDLYFRRDNRTTEFWTKAVTGKKYLDKDVYVLTSNYTFSGAEEFTYNLKNLKRSTTIGETTGGGANPGDVVRLNEHFGIFVPGGRAINPYTKTNWEGTGVEPDVKTAKEMALKTAYVMALTKAVEKQTIPDIKNGMKDLIEKTQKEIDEMKKK
jgi:hypothetical protein